MHIRFDGQAVVVTGAAQGNGAAMARGFAAAGAKVALVDRKAEEAREVAAQIRADGGQAEAFEADVGDAQTCARLAEAVAARFGPIHVLVNNAGFLVRAPLDEGDPLQAWRSTMRVNLDGPFHMTLAFMEQLKTNKGAILNVGSVQTFISSPNSVPYTASKGGVGQLTKGLACEFAPHGVRVNAIAPGVFITPMTQFTLSDPQRTEKLLSHVPMKRPARSEEIVGATLFLCSTQASYITGAILPVDGGFLAT